MISRQGSGTPRQGKTYTRLSTSSLGTRLSNTSVIADKSLSLPANKTPTTSNKASTSSTRESNCDIVTTPCYIKLSPVSKEVSPGSNRVSPVSIKVSPSSNQSSPKENHLSQNLTLPSETDTNEKQSSPPYSIQQNTFSSQSENGEEMKPLLQPRGSRSSASSSSSRSSCQSQTNKNRKKKRN